MNNYLVMVPTYNEAQNVEPLLNAVLKLECDVDILFVDDNSPDGTGEIVDRLARVYPNVYVQHRPNKMGIGSAHKAGISWAYSNRYPYLITMDCDFSHSPEAIRQFIAAKDLADVVVGTRFVPEGLKDWGLYRTFQSYLAHALTSLLLGIPYDASGGFRMYNLARLPEYLFYLVRYENYSFFWESLHLIWMNGYRIHQVPIALTNRSFGTSKMQTRDIMFGLLQLIATFFRKCLNRASFLATPRTDVD